MSSGDATPEPSADAVRGDGVDVRPDPSATAGGRAAGNVGSLAMAALRRVTPRLLPLLVGDSHSSTESGRFARGVAWSLAGAVSSRGSALLASVMAARILGKAVFGEWGVIQSTTNLYGVFGQLGGQTAIKYVAELRKTDPDRAGRMIALSILVAAASGSVMGTAMIATSHLTARLLAAPHLRVAIATSALALVLITINGALEGVLGGFEAFKRQSAVQSAAAVASLPIVVIGVYFLGLIGAVWGLIASQGLQVLLNCRAVRDELSLAGISIQWRHATKEIEVLRTFSFPTLLSAVVFTPAIWAANTLLVNVPNGYAEMGIFNAADRWRTAILFVPALLGGVTLPMLSRLRGQAEAEAYDKVLWMTIRLTVLLSAVVATPVAVWAPRIMTVFGFGFDEGTWVLVTLCMTAVAFAPCWIIGQSAISRGHAWTTFFFNSSWAVALLTSTWLLRSHGAKGLGSAYLLAELVRLSAALIYVYRMRVDENTRPRETRHEVPA